MNSRWSILPFNLDTLCWRTSTAHLLPANHCSLRIRHFFQTLFSATYTMTSGQEIGLLLTILGTDAVDRLIVCGDLNLPGTFPDTIDNRLAELLHSTSFTQFVKSPTRHDSNHDRSSLLDLVITPSSSTFTSHITIIGKFSGFLLLPEDCFSQRFNGLKLHGSPTPFDFDIPHSGKVFSDFTPITPAEVSHLLCSMSNKSSPLDYIPTS